MATPAQREAAKQILEALTDTIKECPDGAPLGPMYMAFNARGMSLETFQQIIDTMVSLGLVEVRNHCAYWVAGRMQ